MGDLERYLAEQPRSIRKLSFREKDVRCNIPPSIGNFRSLEELRLDQNEISGIIPDTIGNLVNLTELWLNNNQISGIIPDCIGNLGNLTLLWLSDNQISGSIPDTIKNLSMLSELLLHHNQISGSIPDTIRNLSMLEELSLHNNQISGSIPNTIGNLSKLKELSLHHNQISGIIPNTIGNLSKLIFLVLSNNEISGIIPDGIGNLVNLTLLYLNNNQISGSIPDSIGNLSMLKELGLHHNQISGIIPDIIGNLSKLKELKLHENQISGSIPDSIGNLVNLTLLYLDNNQLSGSIPDSIGKLSNLSQLWLNNNQLSGIIPEWIGNLVNLTKLKLQGNQISGSIPDTIGKLSMLEELDLQNNKLTGPIPESMKLLWKTKDKRITISFNFLEHGRIPNHWEAEEAFQKIGIPLKRVIVLGAPAAGKTTLIKALQNVNRSEVFASDVATDGIEVSSVNEFSFWDFGGQETLFATHQFFLAADTQYIIVVDLEQHLHKDLQKQQKAVDMAKYWMNEVRAWTTTQNSPPVILVGTHCDRLEGVLSSKVNEAKEKLLCIAKETSVRCISKVFSFSKNRMQYRSLVTKLYKVINKNSLEYSLGSLNENVVEFIKRRIMKERENRKILWWRDYVSLCNEEGMESEGEIMKITELFVSSGVIVTYKGRSTAASSLVILDPVWLAAAFTSIVSIEFVSSNMRRGKFTRDQIVNNWTKKGIEESTWSELERLFEMFHMLVRLPDGSYYVPAMLHSPKRSKPKELPSVEMVKKKIKIEMEHQRRVYEFNMLPFGLIDRIVVGILHFPALEVHPSTWENLFYLTGANWHILLQEEDHKMITIDLFYATSELENVQFNLFHQYLFNSPKELLHAYPARQVTNVMVFLNGRSMGNEKELYSRLLEHGDNEIRQFFLPGIPLVDGNTAIIEKKLGKGGFGIVWLGSTLVEGERQTVVFKELMNANACESFIQEVIMMKQVQSKYNVKLFGICFQSPSLLSSRAKCIDEGEKENPSNLFMVLEFAPCKDLVHCKEELQEKGITLKLKIALDVARGLLCLHQQGGAKLIHRDVKTENIFVYSLDEETIFEEDSIHAKLGDFGTVVVASPSYSQRIGNYQNTAPEALKGTIDVPYSSSIDVYSFSIVLWELFSGKIPFKELQVEDPIKAIVGGYRPPLEFLPPDLPTEIITVITKSWQADPTQRCSFLEIVQTLERQLYKCNST